MPVIGFEQAPRSLSPINRIRIMKKLDAIGADVYVQRGMGAIAGAIGPYCRVSGRRFVFHSASEFDSSIRLSYMLTRSMLGSFSYYVGLLCADAVLAQTEAIAVQFKSMLGPRKKVLVAPQICPRGHKGHERKEGYVLWVSRFVWYKQPLLYLELARRLKEYEFVMVGSGPLEQLVTERSRAIPNLKVLGPRNHEDIDHMMSRASLLANTSTFEGFPNTFLEAAAVGTPIATLFYDPDDIVCNFQMGRHSRTFDQFVTDIQTILSDDAYRKKLGANARAYVLAHHSPQRLITIYERLVASFESGSKGIHGK